MYGIDLGTTNSVIAIIEEGNLPRVIENKNGNRITPSAVLFIKDSDEIIVGENAKKQYSMDPSHTILSIKRLMGTSQKIEIDGKYYTPEEISAKILRKLVDDANERLGINENQVVITVPAYFDDRQRTATKQAGKIAGLEVLRLINEPTSASLAYGMDKRDEPRVICVYDFGGGTFDVSILTIGENICEVNATCGNTQLGGDDLDNNIQNWLVDMFLRDHNIDLKTQPLAMSRIKEEVEKSKRELSEKSSVDIVVPFITIGSDGPVNLQYTLTQKYFNEMNGYLIDQTLDCVKTALEDAKITVNDIDEILLVGGSTRVPLVKDTITLFFGKTPNAGINPDEIVSIGAAINAGIISGNIKDVILADITSLSLGVEIEGGLNEVLIRRGTTIPTTHNQIFSTSIDGQTSVTINVLQGERVLAKDNRSLSKFILEGIIPAPSGIPQIKVSFDIDVNGILSVLAKDLLTEKEVYITITESDSINPEELRKMIDDGKKFADEDRIKRQLIEFKNLAERLIYQAEKTLGEYNNIISEEVIIDIKDAIERTKDNLDVLNPQVIKESIAVLKESILKMGKDIYKKSE